MTVEGYPYVDGADCIVCPAGKFLLKQMKDTETQLFIFLRLFMFKSHQ
jgi:hypothetical protein